MEVIIVTVTVVNEASKTLVLEKCNHAESLKQQEKQQLKKLAMVDLPSIWIEKNVSPFIQLLAIKKILSVIR
jgi:hypothetical protein